MADRIKLVEYHTVRSGFRKEFQTWNQGSVGKHLKKIVRETRAVSEIEAPKLGGPGKGRTKINYATGQLVAGIVTQEGFHGTKKDLEGKVISTAPHSAAVHEGTRPHVIKAKRAPKLVFFWARKGRIFRGDEVHHPGTPPIPFLRKALEIVMHRFD